MDEKTKAEAYQAALTEANRLYEQYVELAQIAAVSTETDERDLPAWTERSLNHPLGLTITTK